jgi:hypothetical protein
MKVCPNCQREFPDAMRFCQTDGTPLTEVAAAAPPEDPLKTQVVRQEEIAEMIPPDDPFKTMVASRIEEKEDEDDVLQLPQDYDPMATMVVSPLAAPERPSLEDLVPDAPQFGSIKDEITPEPPAQPFGTPVAPPINEPPAPVFEEPAVEAPSFAPVPPPGPVADDIPATVFQAQIDPPVVPPEPAPAEIPMPAAFDPIPSAPEPMPAAYDPMPAALDPIPSAPEPMPAASSPFQAPASPYDVPAPAMADPPASPEISGWNPPPAPVQAWQEQPVGADTPFQPPAVAGQSQTLAIISLICGIIGVLAIVPTLVFILCGILPLAFGLAGVIIGFLARGRAKNFPDQYTGGGLALGGIISGALAVLGTVGWVVLWIVLWGAMIGAGALR